MCTVVMLRRPGDDWPVVLGANRDEMIGRAWRAPARHWPDRSEVRGGLDELAGGSWLGVNDHGVVAAILNRFGTLGPASGKRSRGELVLEALDHADAMAASEALADLDPAAYRPFNLVVADNRDAFWLRHAAEDEREIEIRPIKPGVSMIASGDLDDPGSARIRDYLPRFRAAPPPSPEDDEWVTWEALLDSEEHTPADGPRGGMRFVTAEGFATVSSALVALPRPGLERPPAFRFLSRQPPGPGWAEVAPA
jgi:uncharacterized protein with NRDE domain